MPRLVHVLSTIDGKSEEQIDVLEIENWNKKEFQLQFDVDPEADPQMRERYSVGPDDVPFLRKALGAQLEFDFKNYAYFIEAALKD